MDEGTNFSAAGFFYFCPVNVLFTEAEKSVKKGCALKIQEKDCGTRCMMSIFREKSLKKVSSPEQMDEYIRVITSPPAKEKMGKGEWYEQNHQKI